MRVSVTARSIRAIGQLVSVTAPTRPIPTAPAAWRARPGRRPVLPGDVQPLHQQPPQPLACSAGHDLAVTVGQRVDPTQRPWVWAHGAKALAPGAVGRGDGGGQRVGVEVGQGAQPAGPQAGAAALSRARCAAPTVPAAFGAACAGAVQRRVRDCCRSGCLQRVRVLQWAQVPGAAGAVPRVPARRRGRASIVGGDRRSLVGALAGRVDRLRCCGGRAGAAARGGGGAAAGAGAAQTACGGSGAAGGAGVAAADVAWRGCRCRLDRCGHVGARQGLGRWPAAPHQAHEAGDQQRAEGAGRHRPRHPAEPAFDTPGAAERGGRRRSRGERLPGLLQDRALRPAAARRLVGRVAQRGQQVGVAGVVGGRPSCQAPVRQVGAHAGAQLVHRIAQPALGGLEAQLQRTRQFVQRQPVLVVQQEDRALRRRQPSRQSAGAGRRRQKAWSAGSRASAAPASRPRGRGRARRRHRGRRRPTPRGRSCAGSRWRGGAPA
jgi:hypothetical protein